MRFRLGGILKICVTTAVGVASSPFTCLHEIDVKDMWSILEIDIHALSK